MYTDHDFGWCDGENWYEQLTPVTESKTFSMSFIENGFVRFSLQDSILSEHRIIFDYLDPYPSPCVLETGRGFKILLDGYEFKRTAGCLNEDTLRCTIADGFLFESEDGCEQYQNYFVKQ